MPYDGRFGPQGRDRLSRGRDPGLAVMHPDAAAGRRKSRR